MIGGVTMRLDVEGPAAAGGAGVGGDEDLRRHPERRRDLDNLNKALADLLVEHLVLQVDAYVASIDACHSPRSKS